MHRLSSEKRQHDIGISTRKVEGWRQSSFNVGDPAATRSQVWFGMFNEDFFPRFDFGGPCHEYWRDINFHWDWKPTVADISENFRTSMTYDVRLSTYLTYAAPRSHARTLFQGVALADAPKAGAGFMRARA